MLKKLGVLTKNKKTIIYKIIILKQKIKIYFNSKINCKKI